MDRLLTVLLITLIFFIIYSYNLPNSFLFTSDFGRDMYQSIKITRGDLVLLGSKMNLGGYFVGPYLYYLFALGLLITWFDVSKFLYFQTVLFAASLGLFFLITAGKIGEIKAFLGTSVLGLTPLFVISARYPSNGYTYLSLLLILFTFVFFLKYQSKAAVFALGILSGIILNIHPISILALIFAAFFILFSIKKKLLFLFFLSAIFITFIPVIAFELSHNFVMTKDTFINKSYLTFTEDGNTPQFWLHENQIISSFLFISEKFKKIITLPGILFPTIAIFIILYRKVKKERLESLDLFLTISMVISLILLISVLRFHFEDHYVFSVAFLFILTFTLMLLRSKFWFFIPVIILIQILNFPSELYENSKRSFQAIEAAVKFSIDQDLVSKNIPFNLIQITDAYALVPTGFEYRYFFKKFGLHPNSEYDYKNSGVLLIFSETPYYDIYRFKMWATEEFGRQYFSKRDIYHVGNIDIYRIAKE